MWVGPCAHCPTHMLWFAYKDTRCLHKLWFAYRSYGKTQPHVLQVQVPEGTATGTWAW